MRPYRIRQGDRLRLDVWSDVASVLRASARVVYDNGKDDDFFISDQTLAATRANEPFETTYRAKDNGWVVASVVAIRSVATKRGRCWTGLSFVSEEIRTWLSEGYAYDGFHVPLGYFESIGPQGGEGFIRTITGSDPAAASDTVLEAVPTNTMWRLISFGAVFVTSSDAATRTPKLIIDDGTTANRYHIWQGSTQAASLTRTHLWQQEYGGSGAQGAGDVSIVDTDTVLTREVIPHNLFMSGGHRIRIVTLNFDSTAVPVDDWAAPIFQVESWIVPG